MGERVWHVFTLHDLCGMDNRIGLHQHSQRTSGPWSDPSGTSFRAPLHFRTCAWGLANPSDVAGVERGVVLEPSSEREEGRH